MIPITFLVGDATAPVGEGRKVIVHCCNDVGAWGAGFVLALSRRWSEPEVMFRTLVSPPLGHVQFVPVTPTLTVANLIGQHGTGIRNGVIPLRYDALAEGFATIAAWAVRNHASVHLPRIGCGLAGGRWPVVESLITTELTGQGVPVFVYDLAASPPPC